MSALLFILAVEILAISIRSNKQIKGIKAYDRETKVSLLADDTTLLVSDIASLRIALNVLSIFYFVSGLKINYEKGEVLCIGKKSDFFLYHKPFKLVWSHGGVKSLGISYFDNIKEIVDNNLQENITQFKSS